MKEPLQLSFIIACIVGATVTAMRRNQVTLSQRFVEIISGSATAYYAAGFFVSHFNVPAHQVGALGFLFGLVGSEAAGFASEWFERNKNRIFPDAGDKK